MNMHHIIITGASRGIGHATALLYASMGWNISICSRHCDYQMTQTQDAITAAGGQYFSFCGDMGNAADAEEFLAKAVRTFGTPEILVNNAGISHIGLLQDMTPMQWDDIILCLLYQPSDHPLFPTGKARQDHQRFLCLGQCRRIHGGRIFYNKGRDQRLHQGTGKGAGTKRHSG
jgi:NAD(P)-dependent dehydrogenase (short-subunit alcohol dehydrogenase family)